MNEPQFIYLDHAATTPVDPEVVAIILPWLSSVSHCGNPSSVHSAGRRARAALDDARDSVAALIGADYSEITFTSSGTEADNLALIGVITAAPSNKNHLVISTIEHHANLHAAEVLRKAGYRVTLLPVDSNGIVDLNVAAEAITADTALVSVMLANNEIGTIQPVVELAQLTHARGALFHTDAVQAAGVLPISVSTLQCDLLTLSGHKFYGPKGAAALFACNGLKINPQIHGGGQERERRAGTENVPGLIGFGKAAQLAKARMAEEAPKIADITSAFVADMMAAVPGARLNGHPTQRLCSNANFSFDGVDGSTLLMNLDRKGICASSGAACSSGSIEPSHVLSAIGLPRAEASGGVRFSTGRCTTQHELATTVRAVADIVTRLRDRAEL